MVKARPCPTDHFLFGLNLQLFGRPLGLRARTQLTHDCVSGILTVKPASAGVISIWQDKRLLGRRSDDV